MLFIHFFEFDHFVYYNDLCMFIMICRKPRGKSSDGYDMIYLLNRVWKRKKRWVANPTALHIFRYVCLTPPIGASRGFPKASFELRRRNGKCVG